MKKIYSEKIVKNNIEIVKYRNSAEKNQHSGKK